MKQFTRILCGVFLITTALPSAHAALAIDCRKPDELNESVQDCAGNRKYLEAGRACVKAFQVFLLSEKEEALKNMAALQAGGVLSEGQHTKAVRTLSRVIEAGDEASGNVKAYLSNIVYPEDWDAPPEVIGNAADFFNSHKCYRDSRDGLEALAEEVDSSVKMLVESLAARPPQAAKPQASKH